MPKISVIVPVYKVEAYLSRCVDSVIAQTYENFELILVDDGSPDKCPEICDDYASLDKRIHVIHRKNGGLSAARNTGIEWVLANSDSEWITFIDSDDWIANDYLESLISTASKYHTSVVVGSLQRVRNESEIIYADEKVTFEIPPKEYWLNNKTNSVVAWGKLYKKDDFVSLRYPEGKLHEDEFTTYKILFKYEIIAVIETPIYYYFYNSESITKSNWNPRKLDALEALRDQIVFFEKKNEDDLVSQTVLQYLDLICENMYRLKNQSSYKKQVSDLRRLLKEEMRTYKHVVRCSYKTNFRFYKYAYPIRAKIYRKLRMKS